MAPFLFIIAMEGLHVAIENLVSIGMFKCANINNVLVSHLFYADDVMIVGDWKKENLDAISKALKFFYCISGLKINFDKSTIIGIGVDEAEVNQMAASIGCKTESLPFKYLGIPIGCSSARINTWDPIISKFQKRLSSWKANLLSIGGRMTLISSVLGSLGTYFLSLFRMPKKVNNRLEAFRSKFFWGGAGDDRKIAWVKWDLVKASLEDGGVGIGSLSAMNHALLYKWRWRALIKPNNLWVRVVSAIHGANCFLNLTFKMRGLWYRIVESIKVLHKNIPELSSCISRKVGNGTNTRFWKDIWCGDTSLATSFPRLYAIDIDKECTVSSCWKNTSWDWNWRRPLMSSRENYLLEEMMNRLPSNLQEDEEDRWKWNLNGKSFFAVALIRKLVDQHSHIEKNKLKTRWNKLVPKKINLFVWRLRRDCLPTLVNLFVKGIDITKVSCFLCSNGTEFTNHIFQFYPLVFDTRKMLNAWINSNIPDDTFDNILNWCDNVKFASGIRLRLEAILFIWWWHIWKARNNKYHKDVTETSLNIFNSIVSSSYLWIHNHDRKNVLSWDEWVAFPLVG